MVEGERDRDEIHIKDTAGPGDDHISCSVSSFRLTTKEMGKNIVPRCNYFKQK